MIIRWKDIYETGISGTDHWNKKLVSNINEVYKYICTDNIIDHTERVINQMIAESVVHFSAEKKLFKQYNFTFESVEKHIEEHNFFTEVLKNALKRIRSGDLTVSYKLADFLRSWIVKHMLKSDKEFALFVKNTKKIMA